MTTHEYLWRLILYKYKPWLYLLNVLLWTMHYVSRLVPGLIIAAFFDALSSSTVLGLNVWAPIALLIAAGAGQIVIFYGGIVADVAHRFRTSGLLRRNLLERILELPGARALPESPGAAISRFRDDALEVENCVDWTLDVLGSGIFALVAFAILARVDPMMTVVVFLPLLASVVIVQLAGTQLDRFRRASREATGEVTGAIGSMFAAVQSLQLGNAEDRAVEHLRQLNETRLRATVKDRMFTQVIQSVNRNMLNVATGLVLLLAARSMRAGSFTVGDFALFVYYLSFVGEFTSILARFLTTYRQLGVSFARLQVLMQDAPPDRLVGHASLYLTGPLPAIVVPIKTEADQLIEMRASRLTYRYPDSGRGIENVSLTVRRGSLTVITGRIGSGKTTLLRTLLGLLPKEGGEVRWNGTVVENAGEFFAPPRSAYTPQVPQLFSATLRENIVLGLPETDSRLPEAVRSAVLEKDLAGFADGLETRIGPRGVRLSGGQVQRTAAARALVRQPELLVVDDLSSALDVDTEALLGDRLLGERGATYLVVSHRHAVLAKADHIVVLKDGKVEAEGRLEELLASSEEMGRLWRGEMEGSTVGS